VSVRKAIDFLESRNWMGHITVHPKDRRYLPELQKMVCETLAFLQDPNMVAALFDRACDHCRDKKLKCIRGYDGTCE